MRADADFGAGAPLVAELATAVAAALGDELVGLYVFGSLVVGDFDVERSDLDLLAVVGSPVGERHVSRLATAHAGFVADRPDWTDRVELLCAPRAVLAAFPAGAGEVVRVSPGEPLHRTRMSPHWLADLYAAQERGVVLVGPPVADVLPRISREQFRRCVRDSVVAWRVWAHESTAEGFVGYAVLTLCRALYSSRTGDLVSKAAAARWVAERYPEWAGLAGAALRWRRDGSTSPNAAASVELLRFVEFVAVESGAT